MAQSLKGVKLDLDALVAADAKLMKHVDDWWPQVRWAFDWVNKGLAALGKPPIDEEALKHPGEYFDEVMAMVKAMKPQGWKAKLIHNGLMGALEYLHRIVHPDHVNEAAGA